MSSLPIMLASCLDGYYVNFFDGAALAVLPLHFLGCALGVQIMICGRGAPLRSPRVGARPCPYGHLFDL